jgi:hypothetical protein
MNHRLIAATGVLLGAALTLVNPSLAAPQEKPQPEKIVWGKEVNGLAVAISPAEGATGRYVIRWKNVGKETLELPWVRFDSDATYKHLDDLLDHVILKKPDGTAVLTRKYKFPVIGGPPYRPRTVILEPGKIHQETIELATYVERPTEEGRYQLWIELDIRSGFAPKQKGATYRTGTVRSNVLEVQMGK